MAIYTCPMHSEIRNDKPGKCPSCGMELVSTKNLKTQTAESNPVQNSYQPLVIIIALITLVSFAATIQQTSLEAFGFRNLLSNFMAGFFIVFSGFKLIDLEGFTQGYSTYDLLAKRWFAYGYIYPFIELSFGLAMILNIFSREILWAEALIMAFSGLGVAIKVAKGEKFQCACLGTFLKVPLTKVTLIEDFGMSILALILLLTK